jgi:uncharacterized protein with HEPN domain
MDNVKDDLYHLNKMIHYIETAENYAKNMAAQGKVIQTDDQDSDGIIYKIIQLREEAAYLSQEFLSAHSEIDKTVRLIKGFRNRLVHDYDNVSYVFFREIIEEDLPALKEQLIQAKNNL